MGGCGTQTAALGFGGYIGPTTNITEEYDGSVWTTGGNLNTARSQIGAAGIQTAAIGFGGAPTLPTVTSATEEYDGSVWSTSAASLGTARKFMGNAGTQTAGLAFGGLIKTAVTEEYNAGSPASPTGAAASTLTTS